MFDETHVMQIQRALGTSWLRQAEQKQRKLSGPDFVKSLAAFVREQIRSGSLAADDMWECLNAADSGVLDEDWTEALRRWRDIQSLIDKYEKSGIRRQLIEIMTPPPAPLKKLGYRKSV